MKVQQVSLADSTKVTWIVLNDDYLLVEPVESFLSYLRNLERSPNTVRAYAYHLKLYWEYLQSRHLDWTGISTVELADFMFWLRSPEPDKVLPMQEQIAKRTESTVNGVLTSVCIFYEFHETTGETPHIPLYRSKLMLGRRQKSLLRQLTEGNPNQAHSLKLKVSKRVPKTLTQSEVEQLVSNCHRIRDRFLLYLLHESGMRIRQALGLRHEDVQSWDNQIQIVPRGDNDNDARDKSKNINTIHVSDELIELYSQYLQDEFLEVLKNDLSDYVFVNLWEGKIGYPLTYSTVMQLFCRLRKKTGIAVHPHLFRHTHAANLIREDMEIANHHSSAKSDSTTNPPLSNPSTCAAPERNQAFEAEENSIAGQSEVIETVQLLQAMSEKIREYEDRISKLEANEQSRLINKKAAEILAMLTP